MNLPETCTTGTRADNAWGQWACRRLLSAFPIPPTTTSKGVPRHRSAESLTSPSPPPPARRKSQVIATMSQVVLIIICFHRFLPPPRNVHQSRMVGQHRALCPSRPPSPPILLQAWQLWSWLGQEAVEVRDSLHFPQRGHNLKSCLLPIFLQEPLKNIRMGPSGWKKFPTTYLWEKVLFLWAQKWQQKYILKRSY